MAREIPRRKNTRRTTPTRTKTPLRSVADIRASVTCSVEEAELASGIRRTRLLELLDSGMIQSGLLRVRGENTRGRRLVNVKSLDEFCERISTGATK